MDGLQLTIGGACISAISAALGAWAKAYAARNQKTAISNDSISIELKEHFITRREFDQHVDGNKRNFEALYCQMRANDKLTAKISGCLEAIQGDLSLIKNKLFGGKK